MGEIRCEVERVTRERKKEGRLCVKGCLAGSRGGSLGARNTEVREVQCVELGRCGEERRLLYRSELGSRGREGKRKNGKRTISIFPLRANQ